MDHESAGSPETKAIYTVLVTGANSGLGFAICCRLIDEFLLTRPQSQTLHLLYSTRDTTKSDFTRHHLNEHFQQSLAAADARSPGISRLLEPRIKIEGVLVDLTRLLTVKALAKQLVDRGQPLDAVIWNAGIAGWSGVNYVKGVTNLLTGLIHAVTCPDYMTCDVGLTAAPQLSANSASGESQSARIDEPRMGKVFTANVFGHYMLTHWLAPVLTPDSRIIWISSTSALPRLFSIDDVQGLQSTMAYESSKRLTDLMVLTSELPSTRPWVQTFLPAAGGAERSRRPKMFLTHPGVIITAIVYLPWFIAIFQFAAMYLARWIGSPWHPIDPYKGAVSAVFAALAPPVQLAAREDADGKGKWGSATDAWGRERVARTDVTGWSFGGRVGNRPSGSLPIVKYPPTTPQLREDFEVEGRKVWQELEALRVEWEGRLGAVDVANSIDI